MLVAVYSDLHIHNYSRYDVEGSRLDNCLLVLDLLYADCKARGIDLILFSGDMFDQAKGLPKIVINRTVSKFLQLRAEYPEIITYAISGNHDQETKNLIDKPAITALRFLSTIFPGWFNVIDNETVFLDHFSISGIPYYPIHEHYIDELTSRVSDIKDMKYQTNILLNHQTPQGIKNKFVPADIDVINHVGFNHVFCGHIHQHEVLSDNFTVVGSPLHRDFGDEGEDNGFLIYDIRTNAMERVLLPLPKFERVDTLDTSSANYQKENIVIPEITDEDQKGLDLNLNHHEAVQEYFNKVDGSNMDLLAIGLSLIQ